MHHRSELLFTLGLSSLLRTLSHRRAPELGAFLWDKSPSSKMGWSTPSSSLGLHWLILSGISLTQLENVAFGDWLFPRCSDFQTKRRRSFFPKQLVTEGIVSKRTEDLRRRLRDESGPNSPRCPLVSALFESNRFDLGAREGTKPVGLPSTLASVLFYFPDGFGGLAPENPLLPSLPMCTRVSLWGALVSNPLVESGSSPRNLKRPIRHYYLSQK